MNDPKNATPNSRFAAYLAKKSKQRQSGTGSGVAGLLKKNDTTGMCLYGMLDQVRSMPGARRPGSVYVTAVLENCKIFDDVAFTRTENEITINADEFNEESRSIRHLENIVVGGFDFDDNIEASVGCMVKCFGFHRNKSGYCVAKSVKVLTHLNKVDSALSLNVQIPNIDFETRSYKYKGTILQFRASDESHSDWKNATGGNACSLNTEGATFRSDNDEMLFKGSCDAMSFGSDSTKMYLIELYWPAVVCKLFGVTDVDIWEALAPTLLENFRGYVKANIDVTKSSGLSINEDSVTDYVAGYSVYSNHLEVDLKYILRKCGTSMTPLEVFEYFEEEYMLEYDNAADNVLNASSSLVKNLNEYNGNLKKIMDAEGAEFWKLSREKVTNVFVILKEPISKKRSK